MALTDRSAAQTFALVAGVAYLLLGILGLILAPGDGDELFGVFRVNLAHNLLHLVTGGVFVVVGTPSHERGKLVNLWIGIPYAAIAVLGIANVVVNDLLEANVTDDYLHLSTAVLALFFGTIGAEGRARV